MMTRISSFLFILAFALLIGCGDSGPTNVADNASEDEIANYERLIAEAEEADNAAEAETEQ